MTKAELLIRFTKAIHHINKFNRTDSSYHRFAKKRLNEELTSFSSILESRFPWNAREKMQWYVAEFLFVGESFSKLFDVPFTQYIRETYFRCGVLVALCDLIIDDTELSDKEIVELKKPTDLKKPNDVQQLYAEAYRAFFASIPDDRINEVADYYEKLFDAQVMSKRQFELNTSKEEVDFICREKCGYNFLLLRAIAGGEIRSNERQTWYEVGALIQYCNDAQDMHKDLLKGMRTFASVRPDIETIISDLETQRKITFTLITKAAFKERRKDEFLFSLYVMYTAILAKLSIFSGLCGSRFNPEKFQLLNKEVVRRNISPFRLLKLMLPLVTQYQFERAEDLSFKFDANRLSSDAGSRN
ncbi:MAG: hypothetical protein AB7O48_10755 [Cyclobacteriaceae bacterium]